MLALDVKYLTTIAVESFWTVVCCKHLVVSLPFHDMNLSSPGQLLLTRFFLAKDVSYLSYRKRERLETTAGLTKGLHLLG